MAQGGKLTIALVSVLSAILGGLVGASKDYFVGRQMQREQSELRLTEASELGRRRHRQEAYLDFLRLREQIARILNRKESFDTPENSKVALDYRLARYRLALYGTPSVVTALTALIRDEKSAAFTALLEAMRKDEFPEARISPRDALALACPAPGPCFEKTDNEHLKP